MQCKYKVLWMINYMNTNKHNDWEVQKEISSNHAHIPFLLYSFIRWESPKVRLPTPLPCYPHLTVGLRSTSQPPCLATLTLLWAWGPPPNPPALLPSPYCGPEVRLSPFICIYDVISLILLFSDGTQGAWFACNDPSLHAVSHSLTLQLYNNKQSGCQ